MSVVGPSVVGMDQHRSYLDPGDLPEDAAGLCEALVAAQRDLVDAETRQLVLAARWLDVHAPAEHPDAPPRPARPGAERALVSGAEGTPLVTEFACAEFAALQDLHPLAGRHLLRKVANLRHRHPQLWLRVLRGEVRGWKALETARLVGRDELALKRHGSPHGYAWLVDPNGTHRIPHAALPYLRATHHPPHTHAA
jgi:hypothetical protein